MIAAIEILRPLNGLMAAAGFVLGAVLLGASLTPVLSYVLIGALVVFFLSGAGMVLNDYFDWQIDRINRPYRVIPSGRMTLSGAFNYAVALSGVSIALSAFLLPLPMTALVVFNVALSALYSWKLKKTVVGHLVVSWLAASVFLLAALLVGELAQVALFLFALVFCGNFAREVEKGMEDYKGDKAEGARTIAVALGFDVASWLGMAFLFLTATLIPIPYVLKGVGNGYILPAMASAVLIIYSGYLVFKNKPSRAQMAVKWAMVAELLALALGLLFP